MKKDRMKKERKKKERKLHLPQCDKIQLFQIVSSNFSTINILYISSYIFISIFFSINWFKLNFVYL